MAEHDLLQRPRDEAIRLVALGYLDDAAEARARLGRDAEALHDFRVALRRLRSLLRAWRDLVGRPLGKRGRRRLKKLVRATGTARDAEVLLALVDEEAVSDMSWLKARLASQKQEGDEAVRARLDHAEKLEAKLRERLAPVEIDLEHPHKLAHALGPRVEEHADQLERDLARLESADQDEEAHRARISAKRLRYLVEPFKHDARVDALVTPLKRLQDLLGELHDAHVGIGVVRRARREAPPEAQAGLSELVARLEARRDRLFAELQRAFIGDARLRAEARALAGDLRER